LASGNNSVIHHWVEAYLGNQWVPFDPAHRRFAELPDDYLVVYYGDETFFQRTSNADFNYTFNIKRRLFPKDDDTSNLAMYSLNIMNVWPLFQRAGISLDLLRIILMIPVGAIVTIIFRNVIGLETFGAFLPVLIASAFRETGLFWGLMTFAAIIFLGGKIERRAAPFAHLICTETYNYPRLCRINVAFDINAWYEICECEPRTSRAVSTGHHGDYDRALFIAGGRSRHQKSLNAFFKHHRDGRFLLSGHQLPFSADGRAGFSRDDAVGDRRQHLSRRLEGAAFERIDSF
jgi:hypothetical protein